MRTALMVATVVLVVVVALTAMWSGWRSRTRRSLELLPELPAAPEDLGEPRTGPVEASYVSTVVAGDPLDRISAHGLGIRAPATVQVFANAVVIDRSGVVLTVGRERITAVGTAAGQIGTMMMGTADGLLTITWVPPLPATRPLQTALRVRHPAEQQTVLDCARAILDDKEH